MSRQLEGNGASARPGWWKRASYREPAHDSEAGNPLLLALPPTRSFDDWARAMSVGIPNVDRDRSALPPHVRSDCCLLIPGFVKPTQQNILIGTALCASIRASYKGRNPVGPSWNDRLNSAALARTGTERGSPDATCSGVGGMVAGPSGVGKSFALAAAQREFAQVIEHSFFEGEPLSLLQLVWLRSEVSYGGSPGALGLSGIRSVDRLLRTNFRDIHSGRLRNADGALDAFKAVSEDQYLGTWIVDELQHLRLADSRARKKAVTFFQMILNHTGISLLLAGTGATADIIADAFHGSRRVVGVGSIAFPRFMPGPEWMEFTKAMFAHQYVLEPVTWTEGWATFMFSLVFGVTDLAVKLFVMTQRRAILEKKETISTTLMLAEFERSFQPVFKSLAFIARSFANKTPDPMSEPDEGNFRESLGRIDPSSVPPPDASAGGNGGRPPVGTAPVPGTPAGTSEEIRKALDKMQEPTVAAVVAAGAEAGKTAEQALREAGIS